MGRPKPQVLLVGAGVLPATPGPEEKVTPVRYGARAALAEDPVEMWQAKTCYNADLHLAN